MTTFKKWKRNPNYLIGSDGTIKRGDGLILKQSIMNARYLGVHLRIDGKNKTFQSHRIIAETFINNPYNKPEVNHKNGIHTDNRVSNLEWVTKKENMAHSWRVTKTRKYLGENHPKTTMTNMQVSNIKRRIAEGIKPKAIAEEFRIPIHKVYNIRLGLYWKHIT
jgi:hypothetical protein